MSRQNIISFLVAHPEFALRLLSQYYPFSQQQLKKFQNLLIWEIISFNESIHWNSEILWHFAENLDWQAVSVNSSAFPDLSLLKEFDAFIDWKGNDDFFSDSIANNTGLPWTEEFIQSIEKKINFERLSTNNSVKWSESIIDRYKGRWDIVELASNESVPWTLPLFDRHLDESHFFYFGIQTNPALLRNIDLVEKYRHQIQWWAVFANPQLPWGEKRLLERWHHHIDWYGLSMNEFFFRIDNNFFENNIDKWMANSNQGFMGLSANAYLPWCAELIDQYLPLWQWPSLCRNEAIPWDEEMLEHFSDYIDWGGSKPCGIYNEEGEMIAPVGGKCFEPGLVDNKGLPWSMAFIKRFENQFVVDDLKRNSAVWEKAFKPYVNDEMVDLVLRII